MNCKRKDDLEIDILLWEVNEINFQLWCLAHRNMMKRLARDPRFKQILDPNPLTKEDLDSFSEEDLALLMRRLHDTNTIQK